MLVHHLEEHFTPDLGLDPTAHEREIVSREYKKRQAELAVPI
jgi:hypothetical protein